MTQDNQLQALKAEVHPLAEAAEVLANITSPAGEQQAVKHMAMLKEVLDKIEAHRLKYTKPINESLKAINQDHKQLSAPLADALTLIKHGVSKWRASDEFKALEDKRVALEQEGLHALKTNDIATIQTLADEHQEASQAAPAVVRTESGSARFRTDYKFGIVDIELVPREFMLPNEKAILAALKAGATIPGVKSWTVEVPLIHR